MSARSGTAAASGTLCATCGIPLDSRPFDEAGFFDEAEVPAAGVLPLASFSFPPRYCGVLRYFAQYTDIQAGWNEYRTPGLEWSLRSNGRPLSPYHAIKGIVNPWGMGSLAVDLRIDEGATIELVVRRVPIQAPIPPGLAPAAAPAGAAAAPAPPIAQVGGRIVGRYWYNELYGPMDLPVAPFTVRAPAPGRR
jgi:hypothetical protein